MADECMLCKLVFYDMSGNTIQEDEEMEFCGDELATVINEPVVIGDLPVEWVCRSIPTTGGTETVIGG